jgi:hypothetical protein
MMNKNLVVIDDDSESDDDDQKPETKLEVSIPGTTMKEEETSQCVSCLLMESSDEENNPYGITTAGGRGSRAGQESSAYGRICCKESNVREERVQREQNRYSEAADQELANKLHRMEEDAAMKREASARERMQRVKSSDGKAVLAMQEIIALVKTATEL